MEEDKENKEYSESPDEGGGYGKGYGKRPFWQWILIYAVVGIVIYGLIYYFAFYRQRSASGPTINPAPQNQFPGY